MNAGKAWRPHRFAPLSRFTEGEPWRSSVPRHMTVATQTALADGFQRGQERGYREGYANGQRSGVDAGIAEGRETGHREGLNTARCELMARFEGLSAPFDAMLTSLQALHADYQSALRKEVVELVGKVAHEVIRTELTQKPEQLLALVDETLSTMPRAPKKDIQVHLNVQDFERIRALDEKAVRRWNLSPDDGLAPGECRIKAGTREVDAGSRQRLAACMEQISTQLLPDASVERVGG
jgi:flagellar assembly protein FliH